VKNLLEVNALERGSVTAKLSDVDAIAVMRDVAELFRPRAEVKRQPLLVEATSLPPRVRADPSLLHEVLENLVSNAIKYSPPGRPVRLGESGWRRGCASRWRTRARASPTRT
jgi:signal transduction histidine kinase